MAHKRKAATAQLRRKPLVTKAKKIATVAERRKAIGARLRLVREARGLSQLDVAEACAVTRAAVSQWEMGLSTAEDQNLELAAARLNCSHDWLRTGLGPSPDFVLLPRPKGRRALRFTSLSDRGAWSQHPDEPPFDGAVAEIVGGIGAGQPFKTGEEVFEWWRIPPGLLADTYRTKSGNLRVFRVQSDLLEPIIQRGSFVFIDISQKTPQHNAFFAISNGISAVMKRIALDPGDDKIVLLKDGPNGDGATHAVPVRKLKIIGRCIAQFSHV